MPSFRFLLSFASLAVPACVGALAIPASAQEMTSRPVVQPLPAQEVNDLKDALRTLDRKPRDVDALLNAGYASLKTNNFEAAIGYFGRAEESAPGDPRIKQAQAMVYLRTGRPVEAISLFEQAEAAGGKARDVLSDRGLAYDLVGDQVRAQAYYREALRDRSDDSDTIRRMAVSHAIAGNEAAFRDALKPLIDQKDFAAFRAQVFGLAILGEQKRAADLTNASLPSDLAGRIVDYLEYMPRLTKAQQAAAANLGIFPRPKDIGREHPRIAQFASESTAGGVPSMALARTADTRLEPAGAPFGAAAPAESPTPQTSEVVQVATVAPKPVAGPGFDLANAGVKPASRREGAGEVAQAVPPPSAVVSSPAATPEASFADVFADLGNADTREVAKVADAVDIESIIVRRETPPSPQLAQPAKPATPSHPERYWVQLGTGMEAGPLKFDWRRLARQAPDLLGELKGHTVGYEDKFRLLAGPVASRKERDELVRALTEKGLGVLPYTSPEGTVIQALE